MSKCKKESIHLIWHKHKPSTSSGSEELDELIGRHIKKSIQINPSEAELLECPLLWQPCNRNFCLHIRLKIREYTSEKRTEIKSGGRGRRRRRRTLTHHFQWKRRKPLTRSVRESAASRGHSRKLGLGKLGLFFTSGNWNIYVGFSGGSDRFLLLYGVPEFVLN